MGEALPPLDPSHNGPISMETRSERTSSDADFLLFREVQYDAGLINHVVVQGWAK